MVSHGWFGQLIGWCIDITVMPEADGDVRAIRPVWTQLVAKPTTATVMTRRVVDTSPIDCSAMAARAATVLKTSASRTAAL